MNTELLVQNWALAVASILALGILLFVLVRFYEDSGQGRFSNALRELRKVRKEQAGAKVRLKKAEKRLAAIRGKSDSTRPRVLSEAEEAVQDASMLVTITGDQVLRAEKILRDVILEEFPPNRQDGLRNKYL